MKTEIITDPMENLVVTPRDALKEALIQIEKIDAEKKKRNKEPMDDHDRGTFMAAFILGAHWMEMEQQKRVLVAFESMMLESKGGPSN